MKLEQFLHDLHFDTDKTRPPELEVNWGDAPLPYKLYRGLPVLPLSAEVPLTLAGGVRCGKPDLSTVGHFLWYVFGLTQFSQSALVSGDPDQGADLLDMCRRFVPSGGALYPSELYVYLKVENAPVGVYHYDVAHHRLVLLREGNFDSYLAQALGNRCEVSACFGTVFVSTMFWKNFYKYYDFAYRLQALDAGVLIGQVLEVAKRFGFETGVYFQFLDRAVNHLLGLSQLEESVYAVIPMSADPATTWFASGSSTGGTGSAVALCGELAPVRHNHYVRSRRILEYPTLIEMNEASLQETTRLFRQVESQDCDYRKGQTVALPSVDRLSYDLAAACRTRFSPGTDFASGSVSPAELATLLHEATAASSYRNDLGSSTEQRAPRVWLYGCIYGVAGIPDGAYRYDSTAHALRQIRPGDHRLWLQAGLSMHTVSLFQVPICLHVAGDGDHFLPALGYRGYRIQQMEAGMLVQRILLAASAIGMGGHPLLGFDANSCDDIYNMETQGKTSLIEVPVGPYRPRIRLEGSLHA